MVSMGSIVNKTSTDSDLANKPTILSIKIEIEAVLSPFLDQTEWIRHPYPMATRKKCIIEKSHLPNMENWLNIKTDW